MLIKNAVFFINLNSFWVIKFLYLSPKTTWIEIISELERRSSFDMGKTPILLARVKSKFSLQADTCMPKALAIVAICVPILPSPTSPSILPLSSKPMLVCQYPWNILSISCFRFRASPKIKTHANSAVGFGLISVPHTIIFLAFVASKSIALFLMPLVIRYLRLGNFSKIDFVIGVLSLMIKSASNSCRATSASSSLVKGSLNILKSYLFL